MQSHCQVGYISINQFNQSTLTCFPFYFIFINRPNACLYYHFWWIKDVYIHICGANKDQFNTFTKNTCSSSGSTTDVNIVTRAPNAPLICPDWQRTHVQPASRAQMVVIFRVICRWFREHVGTPYCRQTWRYGDDRLLTLLLTLCGLTSQKPTGEA